MSARGMEVAMATEAQREAVLLRRLREGAPGACEELYDLFAPSLQRFAVALLAGDALAAEELVIQTFADAARNIRRFDPRRSSLSAWLYGIARRQAQGERRRRARLKSVPREAQVSLDALPDLAARDDLAVEVARRLDAQAQVAALEAALSPLEREVLFLHCLDQLSAKEIGQVVGRSERAVHSLLHRARRKARERLAQDED